MANIFGQSAIFPGLGIDSDNVDPLAGISTFRYNDTTGILQLSNNGSTWTDVATGAPAAGLIGGQNITVTTDPGGNNVVSTTSNPVFSSVTASTGNLTGISSTSITNSGAISTGSMTVSGTLGIGNLSVTNATVTGTLNTAAIVNSGSLNTGTLSSNSITNTGTITSNTVSSNTFTGTTVNVGTVNANTGTITTVNSTGINNSGLLATNSLTSNSETIGTSTVTGLMTAGTINVGSPSSSSEVLVSTGQGSFRNNTVSSFTVLNDPQPVLYLKRTGKAFESFDQVLKFMLSRHTNTSTNANTRVDLGLSSTTDTDITTCLTMYSDQRLYVPGSLGIGTTNPEKQLDVNSNSIFRGNISVTNASNELLTLTNTSNTANADFISLTNSGTADPLYRLKAARGAVTNAANDIMATLKLDYAGIANNCSINFHRGTVNNNGYLSFSCFGTRQMTLDAGGFLGIGTTSPTTRLDVNGDSTIRGAASIITATQFPLRMLNSMTNGTSVYLQLGETDTIYNCCNLSFKKQATGSATNYLSLGLSNVDDVLCLTGNRRIGINKTTPTVDLDINGNSAISGSLQCNNYNNSGSTNFFNSSSTTGSNTVYTFYNANSAGNSTYSTQIAPWIDGNIMTFSGSGNNRIRATINGTSNTEFITCTSAGGAVYNYIAIGSNALTVTGALRMNGSVLEYYTGTGWRSLNTPSIKISMNTNPTAISTTASAPSSSYISAAVTSGGISITVTTSYDYLEPELDCSIQRISSGLPISFALRIMRTAARTYVIYPTNDYNEYPNGFNDLIANYSIQFTVKAG